jgi:histidine triad (HIT) family protein
MTESNFELPEAESCYFCDRLQATGTAGLVTESALTATLVNARQHQEGQVIVIPKRHAPTVLDMSEEEVVDAMKAARKVASALRKSFDMDGMLLYQNNGVASGQEVPHFHLHVCPQRFSSSRWGNEPPHIADALGKEFRPDPPTWLSDAELDAVAARIRAHLDAA